MSPISCCSVRHSQSSGVNFTNVLRAAFALVDPKSAKKAVKLSSFFALLGSSRVKAARRTLVKLTPDRPADEGLSRRNSDTRFIQPIARKMDNRLEGANKMIFFLPIHPYLW